MRKYICYCGATPISLNGSALYFYATWEAYLCFINTVSTPTRKKIERQLNISDTKTQCTDINFKKYWHTEILECFFQKVFD